MKLEAEAEMREGDEVNVAGCLRATYAMSGTEIAYGAPAYQHAMHCPTEIAYGATRSSSSGEHSPSSRSAVFLRACYAVS
eukprot:3293437-Rhodomonas_salina.4